MANFFLHIVWWCFIFVQTFMKIWSRPEILHLDLQHVKCDLHLYQTALKYDFCTSSPLQWTFEISFMKIFDGWMTCDFTSFPTVYQSYQDNGQMIMKGCVQWNRVYGWEDFASSGAQTEDLCRGLRRYWADKNLKDGWNNLSHKGYICRCKSDHLYEGVWSGSAVSLYFYSSYCIWS